MASEPKTRPTDVSVDDFVAAVPDERRRADAEQLVALMGEITGEEPRMWGPSMIGFGSVHYRYESGREGDMMAVGFSPRKPSTVLYVLNETDRQRKLLARLGPHTNGRSCLYVKRLADVDLDVLRQIITESYEQTLRDHEPTDR